jgi:hopanoid biosynthesis associated RND transporter like protein HpnN
MAYVDGLRLDPKRSDAHDQALDHTSRQVGSSLLICTLTTAIGFYVFIPTDNRGVAELGLIAGTGMIINLFLTTTLFPALLSTWLRLDPTRDIPRAMSFRSTWWSGLTRAPKSVTAVAGLLLLLGTWKAFDVDFDSNVVRMRDPATESVQTFNEMLEEAGQRSPWPMDTIAPDLDTAEEIARKVEQLDVVELAVTLADYIPEDQDEKIALLEDVGLMLDAPHGVATHHEGPSAAEQIEALRSLRDFLADASIESGQSVLATSMRSLRANLDEFLTRVDRGDDDDAALARLQQVLLGGLTDQLARLREATLVEPVALEDLPSQLRNRMMTPDGRARVQIFPTGVLTDEAAFTRFAEEVQKVVPNATGLPANMVAFAQATHDSFREALLYAICLISILLFLLWRRIGPVLFVLAPLLLSSVLTVGLMASFGIAFNFANVVVIPLLLGIGVDSGIHLVHRAEAIDRDEREGRHHGPNDLLSSTTARAVFYSALTTTVSFGSLAFSSHRGVASLGVVLTIGMTLTVLSNLIVLPALLELRSRSGRGGAP